MADEMEIVAILDKDKLPEDVRKIIEERFSKDLQAKIFDIIKKSNNNTYNIYNTKPNNDNKIDSTNKLFAIQTGTVVGNIYTDNK